MAAFVFIFGSIVGSFLNVVLLRKNTGESVVKGGSRCFSCGKNLRALEMIPILSFVLQGGKCRSCGSRISLQYPIVEFLVGSLALLIFLKFQVSSFKIFALWVYYFAAFSPLFLIAAYDFKNKIIDSHFLYAFAAFSVVEFSRRADFAPDLISSFLIALFFYLLWQASSGRWMGRGDADLAFWAALFLGFPLNLAMLFFAFWLGGIVGSVLLFSAKGLAASASGGKNRFGLKSEIPFAPFLAGAAFAVWIFQDFVRAFYDIVL